MIFGDGLLLYGRPRGRGCRPLVQKEKVLNFQTQQPTHEVQIGTWDGHSGEPDHDCGY